MMNMPTKRKWILIGLVVALLGTAVVLLVYKPVSIPPQSSESEEPTPTEVETEIDISNWKNYKNEGFGFGIKLPKEWKCDPEIENSSLKHDPSLKHFSMSCTKETSFETLRFQLLVNLYGEPGAIPPQNRYEGEEIIIEGIDLTPGIYNLGSSHRVFSDFCVDKNLQEISPVFPACEQDSGNFYFQFYLSCKGEEWKGEKERNECSQLFNKILSTFRFTQSSIGK